MEDPSNQNLFHIMVLPIIGLAYGECHGKYGLTTERLNNYPIVSFHPQACDTVNFEIVHDRFDILAC